VRWLPFIALLLLGCPRTRTPVNAAPPPTQCQSGPSRALPPRLLTRAEYDFTVRDLLGDTTAPAATRLPAEPLAFGFENNADLYQPTPKLVNALVDLAEDVAGRAVAERKASFVSCAIEDRACAQQVIAQVGRRAFRRTLTADESATLLSLYDAAEPKGFDVALTWVLEALLQSPQFLYRVEPGAMPRADGTLLYSGPEMASRLSYFLWRSMPDDALLAAAEDGTLDTAEGVKAEAQRLLASQQAADASADYFRQVLSLDLVAELDKDTTTYPAFIPALAKSWRDSLAAFTSEAATRGHLSDLYDSDALYADVTLASEQGLQPPQNGMQRYTAAHGGGLLAQPGLLAYLASPDQSSPIRRGVFTLRSLMCQPIPDPPAALAITIPPLNDSQTTRQRFDMHASIPGCTSCHQIIDPLGDGFEHFDALGHWRDTDNGFPVDSSGAVVGSSETSLNGPFDGVAELSHKLAASRQVHDCFAANTFRFAMGRVETKDDECALKAIQDDFFASGGDLATLRVSIVTSDAFRSRAGATP